MVTVSQKDKMSRGQGNMVLDKLEDAGLDKKLGQLIVGAKDNKLAEKLVEFVEAYSSALRERENDDLFNINRIFGFIPNKDRPLLFKDRALTEFYNSEKPLHQCCSTWLD